MVYAYSKVEMLMVEGLFELVKPCLGMLDEVAGMSGAMT